MAGRSHTELHDPRNKYVHQVFLSFRGEDVRNGFQGHLFNCLRREGFRVFMDNDGLEHRKDIKKKLLEAIRLSNLSIVTLSPRYAESRWCLDELVEIMELLNTSSDQYVLPVFFDVEPTDLRHQTGLNKTFFKAHEKRFVGEIVRVDGWRKALQGIAALKGPSLKDANGNEAQLILNIIKEVRKHLLVPKLALPHNIIAVDSIVQDICAWIQDGSQDVGVGVIHGQGGIGKTTIAQIVFNANSCYFSRSCFLADIRRVLEQDNGMVRLQRKLISDISGYEAGEIYSLSDGMTKIREAIGPWKILLVLDEAEEMEHLTGLFDHPEWFCPGSKIIITTRNQQVKKTPMFQQEFKVLKLNHEESTKLFSLLVFDQDHPLKGYEELLDKFVNYCGGLPLALCVLAPMLRGEKDLEIWEDKLKKLEKNPSQRIQVVLQLSFDSLEDEDDRNLFLHIALFFVRRHREYAFKVLNACGLYTKAGFQNLTNRYLVSICGGELMMHQLIQEMGREVVRKESVNEPGFRSRLWDHNDTLSMLRKNKGTSSVKGVRLAFPVPKIVTVKEDIKTKYIPSDLGLASILQPITSKRTFSDLDSVNTAAFTNLDNLNLLELSYVRLKGDYLDFPKAIKWLYWQGCPLEIIPQRMELFDLAVLDMQNSQLSHVWDGKKLLGALKILNLSYSCSLRSTPDFSNANGLEWIILEGCVSLVKVHDSIESLTRLTYLNLKGCKNLRRIPNSIEKIPSIKKVDLSGCRFLFTAPNRMESSIILTGNLNSQSQILAPFSSLNLFTSIVNLRLTNCGISSDTVFDCLSCLSPSLRKLDLSHNPIRGIKRDLRTFTRLYKLSLHGCENLQLISQLPGSLNLSASQCLSLERVEYWKNPFTEDAYVSAYGCPKLVEITSVLQIELITKLDARKAKYMGFSMLESSQISTLIVNGGVDYGLSKGVYQCGIYSVFLHGDHILKDWFTATEVGSEILYTIPRLPNHPIRAFNVSCVYECGNYHKSVRGHLQIENLTTMCRWLYYPAVYPLHPKLNEGTEISWLSHWSVMQHRDVRAGDELKVSFQSCGDVPIKCGINIVYEVDEEDFDFTLSNQIVLENCLASAYHDVFRTIDLSGYEKEHEPGTYILGVGAYMCNPAGWYVD